MYYFVILTVAEDDLKREQNVQILCIIKLLSKQFFAPTPYFLYLFYIILLKSHLYLFLSNVSLPKKGVNAKINICIKKMWIHIILILKKLIYDSIRFKITCFENLLLIN